MASSTSSTWVQYARFSVSGLIGTALFHVCYQFLLGACWLEQGCATASWVFSYLLSIIWQHALHQYFVFGFAKNYWQSLFWAYVSYAGSLAISPIVHWVLVENMHFSTNAAFVMTLLATGESPCSSDLR
jgi:putative flippase GtrA